MMDQNMNGLNDLEQPKDTDNYFRNQAHRFYTYLAKNIATCSMVADATGIPQKSGTRYKRYYEKLGLLWEVRKGTCRKTGHRAAYLTTNPTYAGIDSLTNKTIDDERE